MLNVGATSGKFAEGSRWHHRNGPNRRGL